MVDPEKARRLLDVLLDALGDLRRYRAQVTVERLTTDRDAQNMVLHALYVAVQSSIDLAFHAAADEGMPRPTTYQQAFHDLGGAGFVEADLARRLAVWAGLRNVLAHFYPVVDFARVHRLLETDLADLEEFARIIGTKLGK